MADNNLKNKKVVVITGCSSGLGMELAHQFIAAKKYRVVITCREKSFAKLNSIFQESEDVLLRKLDITVDSEISEIKSSHQELYRKAFMSESIDNDFVKSLNTTLYKNEKNEYLKTVNWQLYTKIPRDFSSLESELDGFKKLSH